MQLHCCPARCPGGSLSVAARSSSESTLTAKQRIFSESDSPERDRRHLYCDVAGGDDKARAKNARRLPSKHLRHAANYGKGEGALDCCTRAKINCKCKPLLRTRVGPRV
eukprot:5219536-Pleurochrysis_carterae.AAC.1